MGQFDMQNGPSLRDLMTQKAMQQAQLGSMGQDGRLRDLQMQTAQRGAQDTEQMRALLPQLMKSGDPQGTLKSLMMSGNPQAMEMAGKMAPILTAMQKDNTITYEDFGGYKQGRNPQGQLVGDRIEKTSAPKEFQPSDLSRLTTEMNALPHGDPRIGLYKNAITKMTTHAPGTSVSYGAPVAGMDAQNNPIFFQPGKNGGAPSIVPGVKPAPKDASHFTEGETKAATLLRRMEGSLSQLKTASTDAAGKSDKPGLLASVFRGVGMEALANVTDSAERQRIEAAQLDILDAALTLGTGAAYTKEQLQGYRKSFFPQIGDDEATIKDKQSRLNNVIEAGYIASGRAAPKRENKELPAQPSAPKTANSLPNPSTLPSGAIVTDTVSGRKMVVNNGKYQPAR